MTPVRAGCPARSLSTTIRSPGFAFISPSSAHVDFDSCHSLTDAARVARGEVHRASPPWRGPGHGRGRPPRSQAGAKCSAELAPARSSLTARGRSGRYQTVERAFTGCPSEYLLSGSNALGSDDVQLGARSPVRESLRIELREVERRLESEGQLRDV